ncbi:hypothetical protein EV179_003164 [Coemansia sp. RSA 487]|nr:hypothetical protein LPJ74_001853 [Coemansia sp. RSA 1843]KAJ2214262.1 hypothetical protein EV179_003164 [Coemansia sp. RSA 487]
MFRSALACVSKPTGLTAGPMMNQKRGVPILIGNVGSDVKEFETKNGKMRATFPLATSNRYKDKEGNTLEQTSWHRIALGSTLAERAMRIIQKGAVVQVEGSIRYYTFTNKDGVEVNGSEINGSSFQVLSFPKRKTDEEGQDEDHTAEINTENS